MGGPHRKSSELGPLPRGCSFLSALPSAGPSPPVDSGAHFSPLGLERVSACVYFPALPGLPLLGLHQLSGETSRLGPPGPRPPGTWGVIWAAH